MEHYEMRCLCDAFRDAAVLGNQAANTWWRPTPLSVGGELEADERGEVVYAEVWSPVTVGDDDEALKKIVIVADGHEVPYVHLSGIRRTVMAPPKDRIWGAKLYSFGTPGSNNPLLNTTLKYKQNITVNTLAGAAAVAPAPESPITMDYRIRLYGYVYKDTEIPTVFGTMIFPAYLIERARARTLTLSKSPIPVTAASWLSLPGGRDQSIPKINPFIRYAYNLNQTDSMQGDYQLRFQTGDVLEEDENLYFEFDDKDALFIEGLGVKADAAGDLARTGLRIDGNYHPKGPTTRTSLFPTTIGINELNFGHSFPFLPAAQPIYAAIPKLAKPLLIWNEIGMVVIRDDGTAAVVVNGACVALTGIRLEMRA